MPQATVDSALLASAIILAFLGFLFWLRASNSSNRREVGSKDGYDALVRDCPFKIADLEHYRRADRKVKLMLTADVLAPGEPGHKRLTLQDLAYIRVMRQSIVQYETERPWVTIDEAEASRLTFKVDQIDERCRSAEQQIAEHKLTYSGTLHLVQLARESASYIQLFIAGKLPPAAGDEHRQSNYEYDRDRLDMRLDKALAYAEKALHFCRSEKEGLIRYPEPVSTLLRNATSRKPGECVEILRQALAQATLPDATAEPGDLAEATHALAIVTWRDLNKPVEAAQYFNDLLNSERPPEEIVMETYGDLGRLLAELGEFPRAMYAFEREQGIAERLSRDNVGVKIRNHLSLCNGHVIHFQYDQALEHLQHALAAVSGKKVKFAGYHKREILERLVEVYCLAGRYKHALTVYDGPLKMLKRVEPSQLFETRARLLRFADMLARNGRIADADALRERANSVATRCREHERSTRTEFPNAFSIVWKRRQAEKVLHDC